jgi:hypothetical protein
MMVMMKLLFSHASLGFYSFLVSNASAPVAYWTFTLAAMLVSTFLILPLILFLLSRHPVSRLPPLIPFLSLAAAYFCSAIVVPPVALVALFLPVRLFCRYSACTSLQCFCFSALFAVFLFQCFVCSVSVSVLCLQCFCFSALFAVFL